MLKLYSVKLENHEAQETFRALVSVPAGPDDWEAQQAEIRARVMAPHYRSSWRLNYVEFVCLTPDSVEREA